MIQWIKGLFEKKHEAPLPRAIIKLTEVAKENGVFDDENKIIELHDGQDVRIMKYSPEMVEILMEKGIPVLPEDYTDEYKFVSTEDEGGVEYWRR